MYLLRDHTVCSLSGFLVLLGSSRHSCIQPCVVGFLVN
uniref:Uncharacterized protein n=1 Tax=Anguilla anguilla TaxID=7936 RepID=A0A0E9QZ72_ANGAN